MSINFDPESGEVVDGPAVELHDDLPIGEPPADPEDYPPPDEEEDGGAAEAESSEVQPVRRETGLDFDVSASEAAAMMTERLGKKTTPASFRRMVIDGEAPEMVDPEADSPRWSQIVLDAWLDVLEAEAAEAETVDIEVSPDGKDFYLTAAEAASLFSETVGGKITVAAFRRMVMAGDAPAAAVHAGGTAKWSQAALDAWLTDSLLKPGQAPAPEVEVPGEAEEEAKPVHRDVYDFYARTFSVYYELHDAAPNAKNRAHPQMTWCTKWWLHRSVVGRINAAWFAWEVAHAEGGTAISAWILEHADRHFDRIMAENGPLRMCKSDHSDALDVYPTEPAPEALRTPTEDEGAEQ
ncbi:hypothetical protein ABH924_004622 [Arthrobacter sp. GAS37]|uniref:DUF4913 domain-containing protein n=1 Tax=Arthrobacter sp. GAS37 TaxID=3156261 RepID=UPI003833D8CC